MFVDLIGEQLGSYQLKQLLGQGGYAQIYLGDHKYIKNRKAAIKVLKSLDLTEEEQARFRKEAQIIADLDHPHIIRILDFGIEPDPLNGLYKVPYIVMTWAQEGSLRDRYPEGTRLPLDEIVSYIKQVAGALQYAHDQPEGTKVVHCDVKPENMLYFGPDEIRLSDFGIAVVNHKSTEFPIQPEGSQKQAQIKVFGTVGYMAPERFYGLIKRASDQYSLAVIAYEWLTGHCPFLGNDQQVMYAHVQNTPPSLHSRFQDISKAVEAVVMRALSKEPQDRYPTVKAFAEAFTLAAQGNMTIDDVVKIATVDNHVEVAEETADDDDMATVGEVILLSPSQQPIESQINQNMVVAPTPLAAQSNEQSEAKDELPESQLQQQPPIPKDAVSPVDDAVAKEPSNDSSPSAEPVIQAGPDKQSPEQQAGTPPTNVDRQQEGQGVAQQQANRASPPPSRPGFNQRQANRAIPPPQRPNPIRVQANQGNAQKQIPDQQGGNQQPNQATPPPPRPNANKQQANQGSAQAQASQQRANQQHANRQQASQQRANRQQANQGGTQQQGNQGSPSPNSNQRQNNQQGPRPRSNSFYNSPTAGFSPIGSGMQTQSKNEFLQTFDFVPDWLKPYLRTFRPFAEMREFVVFRWLNYMFIFISAVLLTVGLLPLWFLTICTLPLMVLFFRFFFLMLVNRVVAGIAGAIVALYYGICWAIFAIFLSSFPRFSWLPPAEYIALLVCIISIWFNIRFLRNRLKY